MRAFLDLTRALADATRLRVLCALRGRELCACQLTELLGLAPSTMSKHFQLLRRGGLVDARKAGRWVYYARPGGPAPRVVREALAWIDTALAREPEIVADGDRLERILKADPADLCRRQCRR